MSKILSLISKLNNSSKGIIISTVKFNQDDIENNMIYLEDVRIEKTSKFEVITFLGDKVKDENLTINDINLNVALE